MVEQTETLTAPALARQLASGPAGDAPLTLLAVAAVVLLLSALAVALNVQRARREEAAEAAAGGRKRLRRKMSSIGKATLVTEVATNLSIPVTVLTLRGALTKQQYEVRLRERMAADDFFRRFRSLVSVDKGEYAFTELPDFDVATNVREHTLRDGETTISYAESLVNTPLDFARPLWEMHVIYDPADTANASVAWKVHHCLGDGASLSMAMVKLSDQSDQFDAMMAKLQAAKTAAKPAKKPAQPVLTVLAKRAAAFAAFAKLLAWSIAVISRKLWALAFRPEPVTMFKLPGKTTKRLSYNVQYSVATTKAIGKQYGATVNDVMLTVVAGAMRKTMLHADQEVPPSLTVRAVIPVDMRPTTEVIRTTGNKFSSLVIDFPLGVSDPLTRLGKIRSSMNEAKNSLEKFFTYMSSHFVSALPPPLMRFCLHYTTSRLTVAISNVRASAFEISICGHALTGFFGFVPPPPTVNLGIAILSVGDSLGLNVLVDPSVGIDAKQFLVFAKEEFEALEHDAGVASHASTESAPADSEDKKTK